MKRHKKRIFAILALTLLAAVLCAGLWLGYAAGNAREIAGLLRPVLEAENQAVHIGVSGSVAGKSFGVESDVYLVAEEGISYLAMERNGVGVYIAENMLLLKNGKAFGLGAQLQPLSHKALLSHLGTICEGLKFTRAERSGETVYSVTVTGDQADALLAAASLGEVLPDMGLEGLEVTLTERENALEKITFSGSGSVKGTGATLQVTLSGFRTLPAGAYPIPEAVKESVATLDPEELFDLTEDLYRLVLALAPFGDGSSLDGTLSLAADCGPLRLDTELKLSQVKSDSASHLDPEKLRALPEVLGWLCMEGEVSCVYSDGGFLYTLALDQEAMAELTRMILPEMAQYAGDLTAGTVTVAVKNGTVTAMQLAIEGGIHALIAKIPISLQVTFYPDV